MIEYLKKYLPHNILTKPNQPLTSLLFYASVCLCLLVAVMVGLIISFPNFISIDVGFNCFPPSVRSMCVVALCLCASCHRGFSRFSFYFPSHHSTVPWVCLCLCQFHVRFDSPFAFCVRHSLCWFHPLCFATRVVVVVFFFVMLILRSIKVNIIDNNI